MLKNTPKYNSNIHFWTLGGTGGALAGQNLQGGVVGYFPPPETIFFGLYGKVMVLRKE